MLMKFLSRESVRNFIALFSTDVLVRGGNFLLIPVFLLLMTKQEFGIYGYLYTFALSMSLVLNLGYHAVIPKLYIDSKDDAEKRGTMLFTITVFLLSFIAVVYVLVGVTGADERFFSLVNRDEQASQLNYSLYRPYLGIALLSMVLSNFMTYYFISAEKVRKIQTFNITRFILVNALVLLVLALSRDTDAALLRLSLTYVTELALCVLFSFGLVRQFRYSFDRKYIIKVAKIGMPLACTALINVVVNFGDKHFVMIYCGAEVLGVYTLASTIAVIPLIVYQSFNFIWIPKLLKQTDLERIRTMAKKHALLIFGLLTLVSLLVIVLSLFLFKAGLFPEGYFDMIYILPMLLLSQVFSALILYYFNFLTYFERNYMVIIISSITSLVAYCLFGLVAPRYGATGIAFASMTANIAGFVLYYLCSMYYIGKNMRLHRDKTRVGL